MTKPAVSLAPTIGAPSVVRQDAAPASIGKLDRLQYLRAIAAFAVVVWHATYHLWDLRGDRTLLDVTPQLGAFGVTLFFVISGYLMATLSEKASVNNFLAHRVLRIYPIYWVCLVVYYFIQYKWLDLPFYIDRFAILLIPGGPWPYKLGVEWTLPFELVFYAVVFGVMVTRLQRYWVAIALFWGLIVLSFMAGPQGSHSGQFPPLPGLLASQWILPFIGGILVARMPEQTIIATRIQFVVGCGLAVWALSLADQPMLMAVLLTGGSMLLVLWAAVPVAGGSAGPVRRLMVRMGDWSYALYLCHNSIIVWVYHFAAKETPNYLLWAGVILSSLLISVALGKLDLTMYGVLKRSVDRAPAWVAQLIGAAFVIMLLIMSTLAPGK